MGFRVETEYGEDVEKEENEDGGQRRLKFVRDRVMRRRWMWRAESEEFED